MTNSVTILHQKRFDELTTHELYNLLHARCEVFVVGQHCIYQDMDGDDFQALHIWLTVDEKLVALCRVCPAGSHLSNTSIGRVLTIERGKGYGKEVVRQAIKAAQNVFGATLIEIEAQAYTQAFYEALGFKQTSDLFILENIPHIKMMWRAETFPIR